MKPGILPFKTVKLYQPEMYHCLAGISVITEKIQTPIPSELIRKGSIDWNIFPLKSQTHDAIMGIRCLRAFEASIDIYNNCLTIFKKYNIPFVKYDQLNFSTVTNEQFQIPVEYQNALSIEPVDNLSNQINNIIQPDIFNEDECHNLNPKERYTLKTLINKNLDLFFTEGQKLSFTHEIKHGITTKHNIPICSKMYRYPKIHEQEIEKQMREMLEQGIIRHSNSPYNSPLWIVPKKNRQFGNKKMANSNRLSQDK